MNDTEFLKAALIGYTKQRDDMNAKIAEINAQLAGKTPATTKAKAKPVVPAKRKMTAEGRAAISAAARKRWAEFHEANKPKPASEAALYVDGRKVESLSDITGAA